jgi:uncharacterized protein YfaS (alpha-2-macroglobulin family)
MRVSMLRSRIAGAAALLFVACIPGAKAPNVAPARTLTLGDEAAGGVAAGPFRVVFGSPKGSTVDPSEVTVVFSRPMRPLELAGNESAPPASLVVKGTKVAPPGEWRWIGTNALVFAPRPRLARATEYEVTVPGGTKALDGSPLAAPYAFTFSTARPAVAREEPNEGETHLEPEAHFDLRFSQPVDPKEVERATHLVAGEKKRSIAYAAAWPEKDDKTFVRITPASPLPLDSDIDVEVDASLRGIEGPLPMGKAQTLHTRTYGPLAVLSVDCSHINDGTALCLPDVSPYARFSNEVPRKEILAHVRVEATKLSWSPLRADEEPESFVSIPARLAPARKYRVVVTAGLTDRYGQKLAHDFSQVLDIGDVPQQLEIGLSGETFEASAHAGAIPITSVNLDSYELVAAPVDPVGLASFLAFDGRGDIFDRAAALGGAHRVEVRPGGVRNVDTTRPIDLARLVGPKGRGAGVLGVRAIERGLPQSDTRAIAVTDLGISGKMSRFGSAVWVTRLSDGQPVVGARVSVVAPSGELFSAVSDANGVVHIAPAAYQPIGADGGNDDHALLIARVGDDWSFRRVSDSLGSWRYGVDGDPSGSLAPIGMAFTDRGVYRPGETVRVKAIFRKPTPTGTATPSGEKVSYVVHDGTGGELAKGETTLDPFGEAAFDIAVPTTAHLGTAEAVVAIVGASDGARGSGSTVALFELAAYKAAEFKVSVDPDEPSYVHGDKATFAVRGDYLFGAPMSGGKVRYTVTRGPAWFSPPGAESLVTDDSTYWSDLGDVNRRAGHVSDGKGALDAKGGFSASLPLTLPEQRGAEVVTLEAEIEDVSRQTVAARASAIVHPGDFYVALRAPDDFFAPKGNAIEPKVEALDPAGHAKSGVKVKLDLLRRAWKTVIQANGNVGTHYESHPVDTSVASCDVTTGTALVGCSLTVPDAGYFILRATAKDTRGNELAASTALYGIGESASASWFVSDSTNLALVADKKSYEVGETAKILVKSPFHDADALVTVERAGIYSEQRMALTGATPTISIPITETMRPNAYVAVHLVRGRTKAAPAKGQDVGAPSFALGYVELSLDPEARRLKVAVTPSKSDLHPGDTVDVELAVADQKGKGTKGEVTLYAVDEGVLMLTGYKTPDPIPTFSAARPLNVYEIESREGLAKVYRPSLGGTGSDKGDEGGGGGGGARSDFRATAYFEPSILTDANGKAHAHFKLPDNLTTYRLMAVVAAEDDRFGFGEGRVVASRPLMARPELPRFLRAGDSIDAGVVISSKLGAAAQVDVSLAVEGAKVDGDSKKSVAVPAGGSVEVRWPISASTAGHATLTFRASAGGASDTVRVVREIESPMSLEAVALAGETTTASAERLGDLTQIRSDVGGLDLRVASTALVGLGDGAEQLVEYPYGCTEQLTSRLVPLVPLRALSTEFGFALPANVDAAVDAAIAKILANQRGDGGFGYWPDSLDSSPWLTAYALWGLDIVQKAGHRIPDAAIGGAVSYLRQQLAASHGRNLLGLVQQVFTVDVLATTGRPDPGYTGRLFAEQTKLPLFGRALLAHAMIAANMDQGPIDTLINDLEQHLRITTDGAIAVDNVGDAYAVLLDSDTRTSAIVLRTLVAANPKHAMASRLARGLMEARKGGRWRSTQEAAWALLALDDYRRLAEATPPSFDAVVYEGQTELFRAPFHERTTVEAETSIPSATLLDASSSGAVLAFQVQGRGDLFYEARLRYARRTLPTDDLDRGFTVRKLMRVVTPDALEAALATLPSKSVTSVSAGDIVLVDLLVVTADPREQVVVDDPLPAGLEAVDATFATTTQSLEVTEPGAASDQSDEERSDDEARANDRATNSTSYHREMKDDRVLTFVEHMPAGMVHYRYLARATTFGRFVVPPTRAECMYSPEVFGRTASSTFEIK